MSRPRFSQSVRVGRFNVRVSGRRGGRKWVTIGTRDLLGWGSVSIPLPRRQKRDRRG
jgi:hypothetical protein